MPADSNGPSCSSVTNNRAVLQFDDAIALRGNGGVVRNQQKCRATAASQLEQQPDDGTAGLAIEVACRLVGHQQRRPSDERPGQGYTLLFAARQLRWIMQQALPQAHGFEMIPSALAGVPRSGQLQRQRYVFQRRHRGDEMKALKDNADVLTTKFSEPVFVQPRQIDVSDPDSARSGFLQPGNHHQKTGLSRAGRTYNADRFASADDEVDATQDVDCAGGAAEAEMHILEANSGSSVISR